MESKRKILGLILFLIGSFVFSQDGYLQKYIKVFGWSRDGKVAILDDNNWRAFILNTWDDKVLWEKSSSGGYTDDFDRDSLITDLRQACRQHGIEAGETSPLAPSGSSFQYNGQKYTVTVNSVWKGWKDRGNYSVIVETGGKRKTIFSGGRFSVEAEPGFVGYSVSPFGERALIIIYEPQLSGPQALDGSFVCIGCHLITGFR